MVRKAGGTGAASATGCSASIRNRRCRRRRRAQFRGIDCFAYDPALRFTVTTVPAQGREVIRVEAGKDGTMTLLPFALTNGLAQPLGKELTLYWIESYGGGVFLPFGDATNGRRVSPAGATCSTRSRAPISAATARAG